MATEYGLRLRAARKHAGLTQEQLRDRTGIAQSTISSAEREGHGSTETPVFAKACGVSALWLATGEGDMLDNAPPSSGWQRPNGASSFDMHSAIEAGTARAERKGTVTVARYRADAPDRLVRQFEALLLKLPEANRLAAANAAYQAMIPYLLDSASAEQEPPAP